MGPAPPVAAVRRAVRDALPDDRMVIVACSGGADSLALAAATAFERVRGGGRAGLITIDHGLQPGSAQQAAATAELGYQLGFDPVELRRVSVGRHGGPEAAARAARYGAIDSFADALDADVLLGHTLDDQAETVLLGLGRGSGPRSIAGMRTLDGRYRRPFLGLRRATTRAACAALGLLPWQDPHNEDPSFQRSRVRRQVLPLLEDVLHGGVSEALARSARLVRSDLEALDEIAAARLASLPEGPGLPVGALADEPAAIRTRMLRAWARAGGVAPLTAVHIDALDALVTAWHGQGPVALPGGFAAARASGRLTLTPPKE